MAVLMGGWSAERDVSLTSGRDCAVALREAGYRVDEIDVGKDIAKRLAELKTDVAFNALHGRWGEDGCIQGVLEVLEIPYTHSGVLASALAMDKERAKTVFEKAGIPVARSLVADRSEAAAKHLMEPPYVMKPVREGSSIGIFLVREGDNRPPEQLSDPKWNLDNEIMVEEFIPGRELTVAVMGDRALTVTEIIANVGVFYDYDSKYTDGGSTHKLPAEITDDVFEKAMTYALRAHEVLGCRGVSRTDFRFDENAEAGGKLVVLETNTQPGMTPTSLVPEQAAHCGISFPELVHWMVEDASCLR